jgi:hypothetical protein
MVWVPNIAPCYGTCLVLIGVRVLYAICATMAWLN